MSQIFKSDCDLEIFARLIRAIKQLGSIKTLEEKAVLAYLILLSYDNLTNLRYFLFKKFPFPTQN